MAKVSLRLYTREIETLIDGGQIEEAIAHCKYILQSYPKHIETYRLLGKAYLEGHHYGEAADIFQRVLSSIPDDFVTHVAMSIIREDEGNLDESIWHMERAYEVQPSNTALQDELRRLLGRRDRAEPEKVRLTRGALARMYAKGNLYQQAIAETRAMLADEPGRADLQVLLAQMCFQAGKRIEATELCSSLLSKFPFCYEANSILSKILPETTRADDAIVYSQRIIAMDPYAAYLDKSHPDLNDIPDNAVMIDRLDYIPGSSTEFNQPEWASSLGIDMQSPPTTINDDDLPSWLTGTDGSEEISDSAIQTPDEENPPVKGDQEGNLIPDWMRSAGWDQSDHPSEEVQEIESEFPEEEPHETIADAAPADLPDWIKDMAPEASLNAETPEEISADLPDWISKIEDEKIPIEDTIAELSDSDVPDWLKEIDKLPTEVIEEKSSISVSSKKETKMFDSPQEIPDWLKELKTQTPNTTLTPIDPVVSYDEVPGEPTSEIRVEPQPEPPISSGLPEWLFGLEYTPEESLEPPTLKDSVENNEQITVAPEESFQPAPENIPVEEVRSSNPVLTSFLDLEQDEEGQISFPSEEEQDDAFAWLENLAAKQGADEESLFIQPEDRKVVPPAWVNESELEESSEISAEEQPAEERFPQTSLEDIIAVEQTSERIPFELRPKAWDNDAAYH